MTGWIVVTTWATNVRVLCGGGLTTWLEGRSTGRFPLLATPRWYNRWYPPVQHEIVKRLVRQRVQRIRSELGKGGHVEGHVYVLTAEDVALLALAEVE